MLPVFELIRAALQSIRASLFRASLTILGIVIGVASVISMVALGQGAQKSIDDQIQALGANVLMISSGYTYQGGVARQVNSLTADDAQSLVEDARLLQRVVPELGDRLQLKYRNQNESLWTIGTTPSYADLYDLEVAKGRMLTAADNAAKRRVVVLGYEVPSMLGSTAAAMIDSRVTIRSVPFKVIGVFKRKGAVGYSTPDETIWIPLQTAQYRLMGSKKLPNIAAEVLDGVGIEVAIAEIERVLRRNHRLRPGEPNDFSIDDQKQLLDARREASETFATLLAGVAAISLLVGGIGIMNIMLVTVTERTKEIGVRKACGAGTASIFFQFLVECVVLSLIGGAVGIMVGLFFSFSLAHFWAWETEISALAIMLAFGFSFFVGVFFGTLPAHRAAHLDPIEALRYE